MRSRPAKTQSWNDERQEDMGHLLDTDFMPDDRIVVYVGGQCMFEDAVENAGDSLKRICDRADMYLLSYVEDCKAVFVAMGE